MPVFRLGKEIVFPHPLLREPDGLMAAGGDLSLERLRLAYSWGIFPWYHDDLPFLWWWTCPRLMLRTDRIHISHSMRSLMSKNIFRVTFNTSFSEVIHACASVERKDQPGTWILPEMIQAYEALHEKGDVISVEVWQDSVLAGGLYGVLSGHIFSGESMFSIQPNTSKLALIHLCSYLQSINVQWIDCQQDTPHMKSMGAELLDETQYLELLRRNQRTILQQSDNAISGSVR